MDMVPNSGHDWLMAAMGALVPVLIQTVQSLVKSWGNALQRKADSLWKEDEKSNSDRPPAKRREAVRKELGRTLSGAVVPAVWLDRVVKEQEKKNGNGDH